VSNAQTNRVSVTLTAAQVQAVKAALQTILQQLPFLVGLTVEERQSLPKINIANKSFVEDSLAAMNNNATLLPAYLNVVEVQKDFTLYRQLDELVLLANQLTERLRDTQILAGSEAYSNALIGYRLFEAAAKAGLPGADTVYEGLRERFEGQGGRLPTTPAPEVGGEGIYIKSIKYLQLS